jgi:hypothetical protein
MHVHGYHVEPAMIGGIQMRSGNHTAIRAWGLMQYK